MSGAALLSSAPLRQAPDATTPAVHSAPVAADNTNTVDDATDANDASSTTTDTAPSMVDTFLTLFVAEIENQDPTDPADPTDYIDQLSSMAQVAMMNEVSTEMNTDAVLMSNLQVMALGNMVGDEIMVQTDTVEVDDDAIHGRITLDGASTTVDLHFTDDAGDDYVVPLGAQSAGQVSFDVDPADYGIPPGDYQVSVVTDTGEEEVPIEVAGVVKDVRIPLDGGTPVLNVSGVGEVPFTMISQFGIPDASSGAQDTA